MNPNPSAILAFLSPVGHRKVSEAYRYCGVGGKYEYLETFEKEKARNISRLRILTHFAKK